MASRVQRARLEKETTPMTNQTFKMLGLATTLAMALLACAAPAADDGAGDDVESSTDGLRVSNTGGVKKKGDLEADGYTCTTWPGTTVTECTKFGHDTYTCDPAGRCTVLRVVNPTYPIFVSPEPALLAP
jgi:hypothetical protein